eukprot:jgi/Ulvmu1/3384/UM159_0001.1
MSATTIKVDEGRLFLVAAGVGEEPISGHCLERSQLLEDILSSSGSQEDASIPVTTAAMRRWMQHVDEACEAAIGAGSADSPDGATTTGSKQPALAGQSDELADLCMASDVLVDEVTKTHAMSELVAILQSSADSSEAAPVAAAIEHLTEPLLLSILSNTLLALCLLHLPPTFHPLALRAHHPSIDTSNSLPLSPIPPAAMHAAISATAALTRLCDLSFAGVTLPDDRPPNLECLSSLSSITALNFSKTSPSLHAAAALAAALPSLPLLATLNLSGNTITSATLRLGAAIGQCTALQRLNLADTMPFTLQGYHTRRQLLLNLPKLLRLTSLSLGGRGCMPFSQQGYELAWGMAALQESIAVLPDLRELAVEYNCYVLYDEVATVSKALAGMTQIRAFRYTVPHVLECNRTYTGRLMLGLGAMAALSSLDLDFAMAHQTRSSARCWERGLSELTRLQSLTLRNFGYSGNDAARLADVMPALVGLTSLHIDSETMARKLWRELDAVTVAACALPRLRVLHVPVQMSADSHACCEALLGATRIHSLTVTMWTLTKPPGQAHDLVPWLPLLPFAVRLDIWAAEDDEWLRPLVPALAAHSTMRSVALRVSNVPVDGAARAVLDAAAKVSSLRQVIVSEKLRWHGALGMATRTFCDDMTRLTALTGLKLSVGCSGGLEARNVDAPPMLRSAAVSTGMTGLRELALGVYAASAHTEYMAVLPRLALHAFAVAYVRPEDAGLLRELLRHLPHVREGRVPGIVRSPDSSHLILPLPLHLEEAAGTASRCNLLGLCSGLCAGLSSPLASSISPVGELDSLA